MTNFILAVPKKNPTPTIFEIELSNLNHFFPYSMGRSDLSLEAQIRKLWEWDFFWTPHDFANGPQFVALAQLQETKTGSKICCTQSTIYIF